jgi:hypothetical protein
MAENKSGQGAKDEIKKGMSEARKEGGKGASGSDQITKGMSETGSGSTTDSSAGSDKVSPAEER